MRNLVLIFLCVLVQVGYSQMDREFDSLYNIGVEHYDKKEYDKAYEYFEPLINRAKADKVFYTVFLSSTGYIAWKAGKINKAEEFLKKAIKLKDPNAVFYLSEMYDETNQKKEKEKLLKKAVKKFADNEKIHISLINHYIETKNVGKKSQKTIESALKKNIKPHLLYFTLGTIFYDKGLIDEAENYYIKSLEKDSTYMDALYNLGVLYYNQAAEIYKVANDEFDEKKYKDLKSKADDLLNKAMPYFERVLTIQPDEKYVIQSLKLIYTRLGLDEKYQELKE